MEILIWEAAVLEIVCEILRMNKMSLRLFPRLRIPEIGERIVKNLKMSLYKTALFQKLSLEIYLGVYITGMFSYKKYQRIHVDKEPPPTKERRIHRKNLY